MKKNILIGIGSILALLLIWGAFAFLFSENNEEDLGVPIAEVQTIKKQLRYKHLSNFFWADASQQQKLYNKSEVFTGDSSEALIQLKNKDQILLPEDTLLLISEDKKQPGVFQLNLEKGSLNFRGVDGGRLVVTLGKRKIKMSSKAAYGFFLQKTAKGDLTVSVSEGMLDIESKAAKKQVARGQAIELVEVQGSSGVGGESGKNGAGSDESGDGVGGGGVEGGAGEKTEVVMNEIGVGSIALLNPPQDKNIYGIPYEFFRWKAPEADKTFIEYGNTDNFLVASLKEEVSTLSESLIPEGLKEGNYYWRIFTLKNNVPQFSEVRRFRKERHSNSKLGTLKLTFKDRGKWQLTIPVVGSQQNDKFNFQISQDEKFKDIFDEYQGTEPLTSFIDTPGTYFLRSRKFVGEGGYSDWGATERFVIRPPLEPPSLSLTSEKLLPIGRVEVALNWGEVKNANDYLIQISDAASFKNILKNSVVDKPPFELRHDEENAGFIRVLARSIEGEISPPSKAFPIKGLIKGPKIVIKEFLPPSLEEKNSSAQIRLIWEEKDAADKYKVELSKDPNLNGAQEFQTENIEFKRNIDKNSFYYFRVWPVARADRFFVLPTPIFSVSSQLPGAMTSPKSLTPKKKEIFLVPKGLPISIKFSWTPVEDKEVYILQLSKDKSFTQPLEYNVAGEQYVLNIALTGGQWYHRVRAKNKYQASAWSDIGEFYVGVSE